MQETLPVLCHPTAYSLQPKVGSEYMAWPLTFSSRALHLQLLFIGLAEIVSLRFRCLNSNIVVKRCGGCDL